MLGADLKLLIPAAMNSVYLNTGTLGPTPSTALAAAAASELEWVEAGPGQVSHYETAHAKVRQFAERVQQRMRGGVVSITENNSESLIRVLWGLRWEAGDEIITTDHEHDAVLLSLSSIMRQFGIRVRVIALQDPIGFVEALTNALNPRTRLVLMSHVSYQTGWELPVGEVADAIRRHPDCRLLVDGAQGLGNIVVDPERLGVDYYVFCGHKWMLAPAGWAGLWVRQQRREEIGTRWPQKPYPVDPRLLESGPLSAYSQGGDDLEYGTRCWPRVAGWSVTWDYFEEEGFFEHAAYQLSLRDEAREAVLGVPGFDVMDPVAGMAKTALMTVSSRQWGSGLADHLAKRGVVVKPEPFSGGVRLAFAAFNTRSDIEALITALREL